MFIGSKKRVLAIVGSRNFTDVQFMRAAIKKFINKHGPFNKIVSGSATGADTFAEVVAAEANIPFKVFPALWTQHGKRAGPMRNTLIVERATHVIAFPTINGRGTWDTIYKAQKKGARP